MATHKATRTRPYLMTAAAVASAAAIVGASPAFVPSASLALGGAPSPNKLVTANYELAALSDITAQGISDAYFFGWGGYVGSGYPNDPDPYYPEIHGVYVSGVSGVSYYLIDNVLDTFTDFNLDNYYYEIGWLNGGNPNAGYSGIGAVIYVGTNEFFGEDSPISQLTKTIFYYGTYPTIIGSVVSILQSVVPTFDIGPLEVGGGILATLYFYGATPDGSFNYGTPGLSALLAYVSTAITGLLPTAAATAAPAAAALAATDTSTEASADSAAKAKAVSATSSSGVGGFKSESGTDSAAAAESNAAASESADAASSVAASAEETGAEAAGTEAAGTEAAGADSSADAADAGEASVDANAASADSTDAGPSTGSASGKSGHASKRPNVVSQIAGKVRSALGGGKKSGDRNASGSEGSSEGGSASSDN